MMYTTFEPNPEEIEVLPTPAAPSSKVIRKIIDIRSNSSIIKLDQSLPPDFYQNVQAQRLVQSSPNTDLRPSSVSRSAHNQHQQTESPDTKNLKIGESKDVVDDDQFHPLYFDEFIPNLQPPPPLQLQPMTKRNFRVLPPPYPFRFVNSGPRPRAFSMVQYPKTLIYERRFPQVDYYRYPQNAMNIQDIIKYLTNKQYRNQLPSNKIAFSGKIRTNMDSESAAHSTQIYDRQNNQEVLHSGEQYPYNDPFYRFKPTNPSEINLLAPKQFRFAPSLLQNHKFVPEKEQQNANKMAKTKPVSVMLDIYPIPNSDDTDEAAILFKQNQMSATRKPVFVTPVSNNPSNHYNNLNSLYHLSNNPAAQNTTQLSNINKNGKVNFYDVTGFQYNGGSHTYIPVQPNQDDNNQEKMVVHLNLYPRKKVRTRSNFESYPTTQQFRDSVQISSNIQNISIPVNREKFVENNDSGNPNISVTQDSETDVNTENELYFYESLKRHLQRTRIPKNMTDINNTKTYSLPTLSRENYMNTSEQTMPRHPSTSIQNSKANINSQESVFQKSQYHFFPTESKLKNPSSYEKQPIQNSQEIVSQRDQYDQPMMNLNGSAEIAFETGFYPVDFDNYTFHSQPLDKNYMANLPTHYGQLNQTMTISHPNLDQTTPMNNSEIVQFYESEFQDRNDNFSENNRNSEEIDRNYQLEDELQPFSNIFEIDPNLKNHKPYFSGHSELLVNEK